LEAFEIIWVGERESSNSDNTDREEKYSSQHHSSFNLVPSHSTFETSSPKKKKDHHKVKTVLCPLWKQTTTFQIGVQLSHITFLFFSFLTIKSLPKLEPYNADVSGVRKDREV